MADKTDAERAAWLDGYKAAAATAASFQVRVDSGPVDSSLNTGAQMVASILAAQVSRFEQGKEHG